MIWSDKALFLKNFIVLLVRLVTVDNKVRYDGKQLYRICPDDDIYCGTPTACIILGSFT